MKTRQGAEIPNELLAKENEQASLSNLRVGKIDRRRDGRDYDRRRIISTLEHAALMGDV
jgi:hypothetical protein